MFRPPNRLLVLLIVAVLVGGPWWYWSYQGARFRNFHEVREGVLFRSGQMPLDGLKRAILDNGIKTVVTLRDSRRHPDQPPPDSEEEQWCRDNYVNYFRLPPVAWSAEDGSIPAEQSVRQFVEVMRNPANYPVLIHCLAGIHRTGAFCAVYRMEIEHWSNAEAVEEMVQMGYDNIEEHEDLRNYLENYQPSWRQVGAGPASNVEGRFKKETKLTILPPLEVMPTTGAGFAPASSVGR
jgi:tyrosine-protein phosphatase SIW14